MDIEGKIIMDLPLEEGISKAGNPWKKKGWVLETFGQYPNVVKFDVFGERVNTMVFEVGKSYIVSVDAKSREFNGKWYTDISAYNYRPSNIDSQNMPGQNSFNPQGQQYGPQMQSGPVFNTNPAQIAQPPIHESDPSEELPF